MSADQSDLTCYHFHIVIYFPNVTDCYVHHSSVSRVFVEIFRLTLARLHHLLGGQLCKLSPEKCLDWLRNKSLYSDKWISWGYCCEAQFSPIHHKRPPLRRMSSIGPTCPACPPFQPSSSSFSPFWVFLSQAKKSDFEY